MNPKCLLSHIRGWLIVRTCSPFNPAMSTGHTCWSPFDWWSERSIRLLRGNRTKTVYAFRRNSQNPPFFTTYCCVLLIHFPKRPSHRGSPINRRWIKLSNEAIRSCWRRREHSWTADEIGFVDTGHVYVFHWANMLLLILLPPKRKRGHCRQMQVLRMRVRSFRLCNRKYASWTPETVWQCVCKWWCHSDDH